MKSGLLGSLRMPIHDWTRVQAGDFHDFHQCWVVAIRSALNAGRLPPGYFAMAEQVTGRPIPDVVTLESFDAERTGEGGIAVASAPPAARVVTRLDAIRYADRVDRVVIRHGRGRVVAVIEILSPGNKESRSAIRSFVEKSVDFLRQGVSLLIVDLFPPTPRDPQGIHKAILEELCDQPFESVAGKPLTVAAYQAGVDLTAYVEPIGVGDPLPSLPIFLSETRYIPAPLELTYQEAWKVFPDILKREVERGSGV